MAGKSWWVEILKTGTWTDARGQEVTFTVEDLDQIVASHDEIYPDVEPVLRLGDHPDLEPGVKPAVGWVPKLKREGEKLLGLFSDVPEIALAAFQKKLYKNVSAGLWKGWRYKGKTHPYVLNHVAVLGAELPAVKGLADLQAYLSDGIPLEIPEGVLCFTQEREQKKEKPMATELEIRLEKDLDAEKGKVVTLTEQKKTVDTDLEKVRAENKVLKAEALEFAEKEAQADVEAVVSEYIKAGRILPKDKDNAIATGLALRAASVDLKDGDTNPFDAWKTMLANGGKAVDLKESGKTGDEDQKSTPETEMKAGADAARAATGQKAVE